jgi:hypothetical protein
MKQGSQILVPMMAMETELTETTMLIALTMRLSFATKRPTGFAFWMDFILKTGSAMNVLM